MTDHCIASIRKREDEKKYRVYVTEVLRGIGQSLSGSEIISYLDWIEPEEETEEEPDKRADEIINDLKQKLMRLGDGRI